MFHITLDGRRIQVERILDDDDYGNDVDDAYVNEHRHDNEEDSDYDWDDEKPWSHGIDAVSLAPVDDMADESRSVAVAAATHVLELIRPFMHTRRCRLKISGLNGIGPLLQIFGIREHVREFSLELANMFEISAEDAEIVQKFFEPNGQGKKPNLKEIFFEGSLPCPPRLFQALTQGKEGIRPISIPCIYQLGPEHSIAFAQSCNRMDWRNWTDWRDSFFFPKRFVTKEAAEMFVNHLNPNSGPSYLSFNSITLDDTHASAIKKLFSEKWTNIRRFYVRRDQQMQKDCEISNKAFSALCRGLSQSISLERLFIMNLSIDASVDDICRLVTSCPNLKEVILNNAMELAGSWVKVYKTLAAAFGRSPTIKWDLYIVDYTGVKPRPATGFVLNFGSLTVELRSTMYLWTNTSSFISEVLRCMSDSKHELRMQFDDTFCGDDDISEEDATKLMSSLAKFSCVTTLRIADKQSGQNLLKMVCRVLPSAGNGIRTLLLGILEDRWKSDDLLNDTSLVNDFLDKIDANKTIVCIQKLHACGLAEEWEDCECRVIEYRDIAELLPMPILRRVEDLRQAQKKKPRILQYAPVRNRVLSLHGLPVSLLPLAFRKELDTHDKTTGMTGAYATLRAFSGSFQMSTGNAQALNAVANSTEAEDQAAEAENSPTSMQNKSTTKLGVGFCHV